MTARRVAVASAIAALAAALLPALSPSASAQVGPRVTNGCLDSVPEPGTTEKVKICYTVFRPDGASSSHKVPMIFHSHGWAGSRTKDPAAFEKWLGAGFGVISFDQRGFGESGGKAHVENPNIEGRDVQRLVALVARLPWVKKDGKGDPTPSYDLADHPVPTGREEIWRFTPLKRLGGILDGAASDAHLTWDTELPEGVTLREISAEEARALGESLPADRPSALAVANAGGATLLDVPAELEAAGPVVVKLRGNAADDLVWGHLVVRVGNHAKVAIVLEHVGAARYSANTSFIIGDGAQVTVVTIQDWDDDAVHLGRDAIRVGRDASVRHSAISFGGLVRLNTEVIYDGPGGEAELLGLYFADAGQHLEHRLFVDHNAPKTRSNVDYKGALQGEGAHAVWIGDVLIRKVAEGIETYESNRNLVLTDGCRADSVPNLEIETGEIEGAGHASTTGRFDDQQLFYLQSRGIAEDEARRLVVHGFFADIIKKIGVPAIEERLLATVEAELEKNVGINPAVSS